MKAKARITRTTTAVAESVSKDTKPSKIQSKSSIAIFPKTYFRKLFLTELLVFFPKPKLVVPYTTNKSGVSDIVR
jgi:hypothetical protein